VLVLATHATQFCIDTAPEYRGKHHLDHFPLGLALIVQAPFDLGHEVFRRPQVIEDLLEGFGGVLRLTVVLARRSAAVHRQHCIAFACCL
jgi:hypothetical protein